MLRSVIISPERKLAGDLQTALAEIPQVGLIRTIDKYPTGIELERFTRAHAPQVVFLSVASLEQAGQTVARLEATAPGIQIIAIHPNCDPQLLLEVMRLGIREFVAEPFVRDSLLACLRRVKEQLERRPIHLESTDLLFSFLPSKAGSGTTTIALNTAVAASRMDGMATLLSDFDLNSGMIRFMLKLENPHSVMDAAELAANVDENVWPQLVTRTGALDILHAGFNPNWRLESFQMRHLLAFMRRNYRLIVADLSGNLEKYSLEIMHESKKIFLVCTPEIPSLHLAREKFQYLQSLDLHDRVVILLNRCTKKQAISQQQIQELVGLPVEMTFPNDYHGVNNALTMGCHVDFYSDFGVKCIQLAQLMTDQKVQTKGESKRRFIEYFALSPAKYTLAAKRAE